MSPRTASHALDLTPELAPAPCLMSPFRPALRILPLLFIFAILSGGLLAGGCTTLRRAIPAFRPPLKPNVMLAFQEHAAQVVILVKDMEIPVQVQPPAPVPYTHNSHAGLWVGRRFPYDKLAEILDFAPHYYLDLHYVDLSDEKNHDLPEEEHYRLFIGGSTADAIRRKLVAWRPTDFQRLRQARSQDEMIQIIEAVNAGKSADQPDKPGRPDTRKPTQKK